MAGFDRLSPDAVILSVEAAFGGRISPVVTPYPSYVNRVYGLQSDDGVEYVAKFYRPDRWTTDAIEQEHAFLFELAAEEFPVVPPLKNDEGESLAEIALEIDGTEEEFRFALFPKRAGRLFDSEDDESWMRIGALAARIHLTGSRRTADSRVIWTPGGVSRRQLHEILSAGLLPAEMETEFRSLLEEALDRLEGLFSGVETIRLHGDLHRGNILDRGDEGLLLIDLDDMANGPAMQDLWLLLPGRRDEVGREIGLLAEGYEEFRPFPWHELSLMEPLRLMRMIHFIAWCARQRQDRDFLRHFPDWGSRSWWIRELEDLRDQIGVIDSGSG